MKESLKLLKVENPGLDELFNPIRKSKTSDDILNEAQAISNLVEREAYLRTILDKDPYGFEKVKHCLADLIKIKDPETACKLVLSASKSAYLDSLNYIKFAEVAMANKAWQVAKEALDVAQWLKQDDVSDEINNKLKTLTILISEKINSKEDDNSNNDFWLNKSPDKYPILLKLYNNGKLEKMYELSFKLIEISPENIRNYDTVLRILSLTNDVVYINKFIEYANRYLSDRKGICCLFLGMAYYLLSNFRKSLDCLSTAKELLPVNQYVLYYLALNYLMLNDMDNFLNVCRKITPASNSWFIAIYFISCALSKLELDKIEFPGQKNISNEIRLIIEKLIQQKQGELVKLIINRFNELEYSLDLPFLMPHLAEIFIESNNIPYAREILENCSDIEVHRLKAWIYRIEGNEKLAEEELAKYRESWIPEKEGGIGLKLMNLELSENLLNKNQEEIFEILEDAYKQTTELSNKLFVEYGLNTMTCVEAKCSECCTKTFPGVTFVEYLYIRTWFEEQSEEYKNKIYTKSKQIVDRYRERFNKEAPFVLSDLKSLKREYPGDFKFDCPYLDNNLCTDHSVRPFACRAYGYSSEDGARYQGCEYYFQQIKGASRLTKTRKAINIESFFRFANKADEKLIGKKILAPLPVWFAQTHEETMEKLNALIKNPVGTKG